jgi:hypothetical protein
MTLTMEQISTDARSRNGYLDAPVDAETLRSLAAANHPPEVFIAR